MLSAAVLVLVIVVENDTVRLESLTHGVERLVRVRGGAPEKSDGMIEYEYEYRRWRG